MSKDSTLEQWIVRLKHQRTLAHNSMFCTSTARLIGVDEVGRGALAGPVVAAAAWVDEDHFPPTYRHWLTDSKKITAQQRQTVYRLLRQYGRYTIAAVSASEIDRRNILQATLQAMQQAVEQWSPERDCFVLVDGNQLPSWSYPSLSVIKGDAHCPCIAAASICAKVVRDRLMRHYAQKYPAYGWAQNAGYGTKQHLEAIALLGKTPLHRHSFRLRALS